MHHPDITAALARQRLAEQLSHAELARRRRAVRRPVTVQVRAGRILVRWGTRLARPAPAPTHYHAASMSA
jgi:hypothetical protein